LRFAATLGHGFRKIREEHGKPEPQANLQAETKVSGLPQGVFQ
jgi:hypothetical protein